LFFFLIKRTKNQVTSLCFFAAQGLYPAKPGSTTGCLDLPFGFAHTWLALLANLKGPLLLRTRPPYAAPLSAEAGSMTKKQR